VEDIWTQFGNSLYMGFMAAALTVLIGSLASFSIGRMRLARHWTLTGKALLTYAIPASILVIRFTEIIQLYAIPDDRWAVIVAEVTFATPYAILVLLYYARLVPAELDDAARIDGASVPHVYLRIYLSLMAPALAAVGTYALLYAWNDYFYQDMLPMSEKHSTGRGGAGAILR
jgi:multiple sugar transport system permease protein